MNYYFQISGLYRDASWGNYDYQRIAPYTLNENSLLEANGVGTAAAGYGTEYRCPNRALRTILTNKPINWSCNKTIDTFPVKVDINNDSVKTTLTSQNNWQNIVYNGGDVGGISAGRSKTQMLTAEHMQELTYEEYLAHAKAANN